MTARRWCIAWVLFALVCAQALGFMHRVGHAPQPMLASAQADGLAPAQPDAGWLEDLFSGHEGANDCRLYDAVAHDSLSLPAMLSVAAVPAAIAVPLRTAALVATRQPWRFHARAPPPTC